MNRIDIESLRKLLEPYNPWWHKARWFEEDPLLVEYEKSILKRPPRMLHYLRNNILKRGVYGIVTIRGPRRVGKSTTLKLLIKQLIEHGVEPHNIFYISLDYEGLRSSSIPLIEILRTIAIEVPGEKYVFIDEASMYSGWALALKNAYDMGLVERNRLKIVVTGSHSMDLAEARSLLSDRQGKLAELFNLGGNLLFTPLRFSEVIEELSDDIENYLSSRKLRRTRDRFEMLLKLWSGEIPESLDHLYQNYFTTIQSFFEAYLLHGGYPKAIDQYHSTGYIDAAFYYDDAALLISDAERVGLDVENLKRLLEVLVNPMRLSGPINFSRLDDFVGIDSEAKPSKKIGLREYVEYLRTTWAFFFPYPEAGSEPSCRPNYQDQQKVYVLDPFLYFSIYSYIYNIDDPFEEAQKMIENSDFVGRLVESVAASHLLLSQQLFEHVKHVNYDRVLMYRKRGSGETDFVVCIHRGGTLYRFEIECKYRRQPSHRAEIVLTRDTLAQRGDRVFVPVSLFLMLF